MPCLVQASSLTSCDEPGLRAAVNAGGAFTFACDGKISLTQTLEVSRDVTLDGSGHQVIISGGNAVRIFSVTNGAKLTLINLTIADGRQRGTNGVSGSWDGESVSGAAINNAGGTISLFSCVLTNNSAIGGDGVGDLGTTVGRGGAARGGAVFNSGGTFQASNCLFRANSVFGGTGGLPQGLHPSSGGDGGEALGGAIFTQTASMKLFATSFLFNSATGGLAGGNPSRSIGYGTCGSGNGGALCASTGSIIVADCNFNDNAAIGASLSWHGTATGSGLGGAVRIASGSLVVSSTTFSNNLAWGGYRYRSGTPGEGHGGAICNDGSVLIDKCTFLRNQATAGASGYGKGGAFFGNGMDVISSSTFVSNSAVGGDGWSSSVIFPMAPGLPGSGGAIYASAALRVTNSTFFGNTSRGGLGSFDVGGTGAGGGIWCGAGGFVVNTTMAGNSAMGGPSNAGPSQSGPSFGGAVYSTSGLLSLGNTILSESTSGGNCSGQLIDLGGNLSSDVSCNFPTSANNSETMLGSLGDYGGPTMTMALLEGSPAIDGGVDGIASTVDQRGRARPVGAHVDSGAFESPPFLIRGHVNHYRGPGLRVFAGTASGSIQPDGSFTIFIWQAGSYEVAPDTTKSVSQPFTRTVAVGPDQFGVDFDSYPFNGFWIENSSNRLARVVFGGNYGQIERIEISNDLKEWKTYATNMVGGNGLFEFPVATTATNALYFRAVEIPYFRPGAF